MKKLLLCFIVFGLVVTICINLYATTEEEMLTEDMEFSDAIHPDDLDIGEIQTAEEVQEETEQAINLYQIAVVVIFLLNILYLFYKIGFNRKILALFLGAISGVLTSVIALRILSKIQDLTIVIHNRYIAIATLGISIYVAFTMIANLEELKNKTEDISWKKIFKNGMKMAKSMILHMLNIIFFMCIGITMLCFDTKIITKEMINIAISESIGVIFAMIIATFIYAIFNSKKTIYKITSDNKLEGKRSLKL